MDDMDEIAIGYIKRLIEVVPKEDLPALLFAMIKLIASRFAVFLLDNRLHKKDVVGRRTDSVIAAATVHEITFIVDKYEAAKSIVEAINGAEADSKSQTTS